MMKPLISLLGSPGSGKGTQAELLAQEFGLLHIVTGDLFRDLRQHVDTNPLAREVIDRYDKGIPQPDEVATKLVFEKLETEGRNRGVIFDPYPLSIGQAHTLETFAESGAHEYSSPVLVYIVISEDEAVKRLLLRKQKAGRVDDSEEIVRFRYEQYAKRIDDLVEYYRAKHRFIQVNGEQSIEDVYTELVDALRAHNHIIQ